MNLRTEANERYLEFLTMQVLNKWYFMTFDFETVS